MSIQIRSRAVILPFPGDPFLLNYWLHLFNDIWGTEVDKLYIVFNSPIQEPVREYIRNLCANNPKIKLFEFLTQIEHGTCIEFALDQIKEDYVMLVEDDGFIFKPGIVNEAFKMLESGEFDIVGSKRMSCSAEISEKAKEVYDLSYDGEGDQGCNFWPNFFFTKTEILRDTDKNFGSRAWTKGDYIESLDLTIQDEVANGDTFVDASLQLRSIVPESRIAYLPQYHGHPDDLRHYEDKKYLFDGKAKWTHVGSLSSGISGLLRDSYDRPLAHLGFAEKKDKTILPNYANTEMEKMEMERRVQWWLTFYEYWRDNMSLLEANSPIREFALLYQDAIDQIINQYGLNRKNISRRQTIYRELMNI